MARRTVQIPSITIEPTVVFFEEERPDEVRQYEEQRAAVREIWQSMLNDETRTFRGAQFVTLGNGQTVILTRSVRENVDWQLSFIDRDGIPAMHEDYIQNPESPLYSSMNNMNRLYSRLTGFSLHGNEISVEVEYEGERNIVQIQSAGISNYEGYAVFAQFDRYGQNPEERIYFGKTENYDNHGNYDNTDGSLMYLSDNGRMFSFLTGQGWTESQQTMIDNGAFTVDDYAEYERLREGVLKSLEHLKLREIKFGIDMAVPDSGTPFQYPDWNRRVNKMDEKTRVAIESTQDYTDPDFHSELVGLDIQNEDGTYGRMVEFYRLAAIGENGRVAPYDERIFNSAEEATQAVQEDERLELIGYDDLIREAEDNIRGENQTPTISFYVAEVSEFPGMGEYQQGLTLQEAFSVYRQIPPERMHGIRAIGFELQDGSMYDGEFPLMEEGRVLEEQINMIEHYRNSPLVQRAIQNCKDELERARRNPYNERDFHIEPTDNQTYAVYATSERFGADEIVYEDADRNACLDYIAQRRGETHWEYYLIADLRTWVSGNEPSTPIERYSNFAELKARYDELRGMDYNAETSERNPSTDNPYARLTIGISSVESPSEIDVLHVRNGENCLVDDFTRVARVNTDSAALEAIATIQREIGFDIVQPYRQKSNRFTPWEERMTFAEWQRADETFGQVFPQTELLEEPERPHGEDGENRLSENGEHIQIDGQDGTWYVIEQRDIEVSANHAPYTYYLLEHEEEGMDKGWLIVDEAGQVVVENSYNGFDDLQERINDLYGTLGMLNDAGYDLVEVTGTLGSTVRDNNGVEYTFQNYDELYDNDIADYRFDNLVNTMADRVTQAMEAAGYQLDKDNSTTLEPVYLYDGRTALHFGTLRENIEWINNATFDDLQVSNAVKSIMHPEQTEAPQRETGDITLHIRYAEPINFNGFRAEEDRIIFSNVEDVQRYADGEVVYDAYDNTARRRENEILLYAENERGETVWGEGEYTYYSTQRPVGIGTYPQNGMQNFTNYEKRTYVDAIRREAWGELTYNRPLTPRELREYELTEETPIQEMVIDGNVCEIVEEWETDTENYILGQSVDDTSFYYAQVTVKGEEGKRVYAYEYDERPNRETVEEQHLNRRAQEDIDRHEAEVGADGSQAFPNLNEESQNPGIVPIQEFRDDEGSVLHAETLPRESVFNAVQNFENANNIPEDEREIKGGTFEEIDFLREGYDRYVGMSHQNDPTIQPYMERIGQISEQSATFPELTDAHSLLLVAEVYYGQQNGLSGEQIDYMLDAVQNERNSVEIARNLRIGMERGLSAEQLNVALGEDSFVQRAFISHMINGGNAEDMVALKGGDMSDYYIISPHLRDGSISREYAQTIVQSVKQMRTVNQEDFNRQREQDAEHADPRFHPVDFEFFTEYLTDAVVEDKTIPAERIPEICNSFMQQTDTDNFRGYVEEHGGVVNFRPHREDEQRQTSVPEGRGLSMPEEVKSPHDQLREQLQQGIRAALNSENYKSWLDTSSHMYQNRYSFNNMILVWAQRPDASYTMGYEQWKDYGRNVAKGAKGIKIFKPVFAYEKEKGGFWRMVKNNLQAQMKKDPSLVQAVYRVGTSNLEFTMNQNNLYAVRVNGKELGIHTEDDMNMFIQKSVLGRIPAYFNVDTVFDVKDTTIPEYLYVRKEKCTKDEMVKDKKGNPIKNNRGQYKIVNTPERQARFHPDLDMSVPEKDPEKMTLLYETLKVVSERNGIHVYEKDREEDKTLKDGADGYYSRKFDEKNPKGYIVMPTDLDPTKRVSVMIHEMSHSELHGNLTKLAEQMGENNIPSNMREIQAESVAYVVGKNFGIETDTSSFNYLATYSQGFELQALSKSMKVIYNECNQLTAEIRAELDERGLNMDLSEKENIAMEKETIQKMSKSYAEYVVEQDKTIESIEKELPSMAGRNAEKQETLSLIVEQSSTIERQKEDIAVIKEAIPKLEAAETRTEQKEQIAVIEAAQKRIKEYKQDYQSLSGQIQEMSKESAQKEGQKEGLKGLKDRFVADPVNAIESMKKDYPQLGELTNAQVQYLAKSEYVLTNLSPLLRNDPEQFAQKAYERASQLDKVISKNGMFVEINYCEQWTDKPIVKDGALMHPKVADSIIKQGEAQIRGLKAQAEKVGEYFPYNKCSLNIYQAEKGQITNIFKTRIDIGDGEQTNLSDHLKQVTKTETFVESFEKATREKGAKEKIIFNAEPEAPERQPQREEEERPLSERAMSREEWTKAIQEEKAKEGTVTLEDEAKDRGKDKGQERG